MIKPNVHSGHRRRIVERFLKCGPDGFADYEILEMLLFAVNRYSDTNPLSKSILKTVGGFFGLLSASKEELMQIENVGIKCAELMDSLKKLDSLIRQDALILRDEESAPTEKTRNASARVKFYDTATIGKMLVNYFRGNDKNEVIVITVDNDKYITSYKKLFDADFQSGSVRGEMIIDYARQNKAAGVIVAHNHPFGIPYPSEGDRASNKMLVDALEPLGIIYVNHYIVSGERYYTMMHNGLDSTHSVQSGVGRNLSLSDIVAESDESGVVQCLYDVYSRITEIDKELLCKVYSDCRGLEDFLSMRPQALMQKLCVKGRDAVLMYIMTEICLRSIMCEYKKGRRYSDEKICDFLKAAFYACDGEHMGVVSFDEKHRYLGFDRSPRGIVNFVAMGPQLAMEWISEKGASEIYVVHNHPKGDVEPSYLDLKTIDKLERMFSATGVSLSKSLIVSGEKCKMIRLGDYDFSKLL